MLQYNLGQPTNELSIPNEGNILLQSLILKQEKTVTQFGEQPHPL